MKARKKFFTMFLSMLLVFTMMPLSAIPVTAADSTDPLPAALDQTKPVDETLTETDIQTETESTTTPEPPPASETPDGSQDLPDAETSVEPKTPPIAKAPARAGGTPDNTYGHVVLNFNESSAIKLYNNNYITACDPGATVWSGTPNNQSDYLVWYHEGILYLNGNLQDVRINLRNAARFPNESQRSVLVYVKDNVTMSGHDTLLDLQDGINATLHIDSGKRLTLNYTRNAQSTTKGAAIYGGGGSNLTVIGGGELHINAYGSGDKSGSYTYTFGIALRGDLTLSSGIYSDGSPDVRINVSNDSTNTASDKVFGVDVHGLTVKNESFLKIDVDMLPWLRFPKPLLLL